MSKHTHEPWVSGGSPGGVWVETFPDGNAALAKATGGAS